jgi:uncharacterized protein
VALSTDRAVARSPEAALAALAGVLQALGPVVVAFSGGVDSALVAKVAHDTLGRDQVLAVTALSPSLASSEEEECRRLARSWGLRWRGLVTNELEDPAYVANGADRCARCKSALMDVVQPVAEGDRATVVLGVNLDDLGDHRPGQAAAAARGAVFPLVEAAFTKAEVRAVSRQLGLATAEKPAKACLASRLPYGTPVTLARLSAVERAEASLAALGFDDLRVRHHGTVARLEVPDDRLADALERRVEVVGAVRAAGFSFVALDLEGLRSGSLNRLLEGAAGERR